MKKQKTTISFDMPVSVFKEGKNYVAFTPALDLSTSAPTYEGAKKRFEEAVVIFLEEVSKQGTLEENLNNLGWKKVKKKWKSPVVVSQSLEGFNIPIYA